MWHGSPLDAIIGNIHQGIHYLTQLDTARTADVICLRKERFALCPSASIRSFGYGLHFIISLARIHHNRLEPMITDLILTILNYSLEKDSHATAQHTVNFIADYRNTTATSCTTLVGEFNASKSPKRSKYGNLRRS